MCPTDLLVRVTGVEPAHPCGHKPLKLARLPIPPYALLEIILNEKSQVKTQLF